MKSSVLDAPPPPSPPRPDPGHHALSSAVRVISGVTLASRLLGMVRDVLITRILGDTPVGSAFVFAFKVPNTFRRLFGEGALSAAFIPEYARAVKADATDAARFASRTIVALAAATTLLALLIDAGLLAALLAAPFNADRALSLRLTMLMVFFMPPICIAAILGGMLQVHGRFAASTAGPLLLNAFVIVVGLFYLVTGERGGAGAAYVLGAAVVASGITQCLWFLRLLRRYTTWLRDTAAAKPRVRAMLQRFLPALVGMGTLQLNTLLDSLITMWPIWFGPTILGIAYPLDNRSAVVLASAERLYQFPLGVFGIAVATAVFPLLSRHADEPSHFLQTLRRGLRLSFFIGLPSSAGLFLVRRDLIAVLYGYGPLGLSPESLARAAGALAAFAPGIWIYSFNHVFTRTFYAKGDTRTPMRISMATVVLNFTLNVALIWPLRDAGLATATTISAAVQCLTLGLLARRLIPGPVFDRDFGLGLIRTIAAAAIMTAAVLAAAALIGRPDTWTGSLGSLLVLCTLGALTFAAAAALLRAHELRWLLARRAA